MPDGIALRFNLPAFKAQLKALGVDLERKIVRSGVAAAAMVFRKQVIALAPVLKAPKKGRVPGLLKKAVYTKRSRDSKNGLEHYFVGIRQGKAAQKRKGGSLDAFYWRWVEQGHLARGPGSGLKGGKRSRSLQRARLTASGAGSIPAYPFLRPAFNRGQREALDAFNARIQARIDKENAKR